MEKYLICLPPIHKDVIVCYFDGYKLEAVINFEMFVFKVFFLISIDCDISLLNLNHYLFASPISAAEPSGSTKESALYPWFAPL